RQKLTPSTRPREEQPCGRRRKPRGEGALLEREQARALVCRLSIDGRRRIMIVAGDSLKPGWEKDDGRLCEELIHPSELAVRDREATVQRAGKRRSHRIREGAAGPESLPPEARNPRDSR